MPSLSMIIGLLTLPLKLLQITLAFFTIGTVFSNDTTRKSLRRTWSLTIFQHMTKKLRLNDIRLHAMYSVKDLLDKMKLQVNKDYQLEGYAKQYSAKTSEIPNSANSYWLTLQKDRSNSDPVIFYIHGGCFAIQLQNVAVEAMANLSLVLEEDYQKPVSVLIVDYSLTSNGSYFPQQYQEVNWVYDKLVSEGNTNIVVMGDSAGGNLTLNVLQHLQSQEQSPVWPTAVIPISPMMNVSLAERAGSYITYANHDVFSFEAVDYFGAEYVHENFAQALDDPRINITQNVDEVNWKSIPTIKNGRMLIVFGEFEVLRDEIMKWLSRIDYPNSYPENVVIDKKGVHIGFFINETCDYQNLLQAWKEMYCASRILKFLSEVI